jgi:rhodanese-related sulfurtransferase
MRVVLFVVILVLCWQVALAGTGPELDVLSYEWDFGKIEQGSSKEVSFFIKNTGFDELVIDNIHTCCGYSLKGISSWSLAPGAKSEITIICDASRKPLGHDLKYITVLSNSIKNPQVQVAVKADIVPGTLSKAKRKNVDVPVELIADTDQVPSLTVGEIYDMMSAGKEVFVFDVRENHANQVEFISNSIRYAKNKINEDISDFENVLKNIDKKSIIIVYCAIGVNSVDVVYKLQNLGYNAYNMEGGLTEWIKEGYPTDIVQQ